MNIAINFFLKSDDAKIGTVEFTPKISINATLLNSSVFGGKNLLPKAFISKLSPKKPTSMAKPITWA